MRFQIKHEMRGRLRIHVIKSRMTCEEADMLQYYLTQIEGVEQAKVYERTGDASVVYTTDRQVLLRSCSSSVSTVRWYLRSIWRTRAWELNPLIRKSWS